MKILLRTKAKRDQSPQCQSSLQLVIDFIIFNPKNRKKKKTGIIIKTTPV